MSVLTESSAPWAALEGVTLAEVRGRIGAERYRRRMAPTLGWLVFDVGWYVACIAVVVASEDRLVQVTASLVAGLAVSSCFVWAHDAAHGALFARRRVADVLGTAVMLPSLHVYRLWQYGHNRVHHGFTNLTPIDWIWRPWSPDEYRAATPARRAFYRAERSLPGCGLHYLTRVWWSGMVRHRPTSRQRHNPTYSKAITAVFAVAAAIAGFRYAGGPLGALLVVVVPFGVFTWVIALVVYLHHTAPDIPFFVTRDRWNATVGKLYCTTTIHMSRPVSALLHNICIHVPHHVDVRIPFYNLPAAHRDLAAAYGPYLHVHRFRWATVAATFRACKLYDHRTDRWTTFAAPRGGAASRIARAAVVGVVVAAVVGACGSDGGGEELPAVDGPASPRLEVHATEMSFAPDAVAVDAGDVEVVLHNDGNILHDLHIGEEPFLLEAAAGQTATGHLNLEPGRYEISCGLPGHREAGMTGVLEAR